jgi:hypothetical protein
MYLSDQELSILQVLVATEGAAAPRIRQLIIQSVAAVLDHDPIFALAIEFYALAARHTHVRQCLQG